MVLFVQENKNKNINNVESLDFSNRFIDDLIAENLKLYAYLTSIDLSNNQIRSIHNDTFKFNKELEYIDLSNNRLERFDVIVIENLPNLKMIKLNGNPIQTDERFLKLIRFERKWCLNYDKYGYLFKNVITLTGFINENEEEAIFNRDEIFNDSGHIDLRRRNISLIDKDAFQEFKNVKIIDLSLNSLKFLHPDTFRNLTCLKNLFLQWNRLETIEQRLFKGLSNLKRVLLFNNQISNIHPKAFDELVNIKYIHLCNNNLSSLYSVCLFSHLTKLKELTLNGNNINAEDLKLLPQIEQLIVCIIFWASLFFMIINY